jgi:hypothetical protein
MNEILVSGNVAGVPAIVSVPRTSEFIVAWLDGGSVEIKAARFRSDGTKIGNDIQVNTPNQTIVGMPVMGRILDFSSPGFVVGWIARHNVFVQRFDHGGSKIGSPIQVNTNGVAGEETVPGIAGLFGGNFVVTWGESLRGIRAQIFGSGGRKIGAEFAVATSEGPHFFPAITLVGGGGFVIAWSARPSAPGGSTRFQIFDPDGKKSGGEQRPRHGVGLGPMRFTFVDGRNIQPADFVNVLLSSAGTGGGGPDEVAIVVAQIFGPDGALNEQFNVTHKDDNTLSSSPAITALPANRLIATWSEKQAPTSGIFGDSIKAKILSVQAAGKTDFLTAGDAEIRIDTGPPNVPKGRASPCVTGCGENAEFAAFAWVESSLQSTGRPALKARVVSSAQLM